MPSSTVENYLKAILAAEPDDRGPVAPGALASELAVTPGTVTSMLKQLQRDGFVTYLARQGVVLTDSGRRVALAVVRRHRLVETFLVEVMGLDWAEVHEEAEVLEHVVSERLLQRMDEMLGHPVVDPHGAPIPDAEGRLPADRSRSLAESEPGALKLVRVAEGDSGFLSWLAQHGLAPGSPLELVKRNEASGLLELKLEDQQEVSLSIAAAAQMQVELVPPSLK